MHENIFITGFSGSGKSTVGREVARRLSWRFVDIDDRIVADAGRSIEDIFDSEGEARFRQLEREHLEAACQSEGQVVSTGGGMVMDQRNRAHMGSNGVVVCLEATPATIHSRLVSDSRKKGGPVVRPMLVDHDPLGRILALKTQRQFAYSLADWTVHTDRLSASQVVTEVVRGYNTVSRSRAAGPASKGGDVASVVRTAAGDYPIWVGWGNTSEIGRRVKELFSPGAVYVMTDDGVYRHARSVQASLEAFGIPSHLFVMPGGERNKNLETVAHIYGWLAGLRAERKHMVLAVGGGVVGDLAGYVAATFLRGMPFGQVPTSLLAMMDAAVGGKTGVDLAQGKNLVGAFHQPRFVLEDVQALESLPPRELRSGWAEDIKHGLILDEELFKTFEENTTDIASLEHEITTDVIRRGVAIKADVVSRDENETLGVRVLLNYGHTIGHALEAATGYKELLHGEAVSIGMMGAAYISNRLGMLSNEEVERQQAVLEAFGLPVRHEPIDREAVTGAMVHDKKTAAGSIHWVLLEEIGRAVTRNDVPEDVVGDALEWLGRGPG